MEHWFRLFAWRSFIAAMLRVVAWALLWALVGGHGARVAGVGALSVLSPSLNGGQRASEVQATLREIVDSGHLADLRWPDFSDYRNQLRSFYEASGYLPVWIRDGRPTRQAASAIEVLKQADTKGLGAEDYDASRWTGRLDRIAPSHSPAEDARFEVALTICVMRYISDLHIGKVNPRHFKFDLDVGHKKYNLPQFLRERLIGGQDVKAELDRVEPPFAGYKRTQQALQHYLELSRREDGEKLPVPRKALKAGDSYQAILHLTRLLRLLGDLSADAAAPPEGSALYQGALVEAVKHFQERHGLVPDGHLGAETVKELNTPLAYRVQQLRLTLERWRWVPFEFPQPPIVVNIPEFRLRAYDASRKALVMNVIVGKAYRHQTPVFTKDMRFVVFRPYWNVPPSIQRSEIARGVERDRGYISKKNYEVVSSGGQVISGAEISDAVLQQIRSGKLSIRQKPGPTNALGLVKLMFPNEYSVYLHSTPSAQLFSQSRRDFSHGCIRVEKPAELAAWVLRDKPEWTLERVRAAMQSGQDNLQVNLKQPIPVLILYGTAVVEENGDTHFFSDIYGHDASLEKVLAKGYPYPG